MNIRSAVLILLLFAHSALACCMVPLTYKGTISQNSQEAIIFHDNGREELILRINYQLKGADQPKQFAWVITVPQEPDKYAIADGALFEKVFDWADPLVQPRRPWSFSPFALRSSNRASLPDGIELGRRVKVGPYDIQPVRATGRFALEGLNTWLTKNGFPTEDPAHMTYFIEQGFTFLAIRIRPPEGEEKVAQGGDLKPLHLSFKSEEIYYPLRFSSRQGVFDVNLYVLTRKKFDYKKSSASLTKINWASSKLKRNVSVQAKFFPLALDEVYAKGALESPAGKWYLNVLRTRRTNRGDAIARWDSDVFFHTAAKSRFFPF